MAVPGTGEVAGPGNRDSPFGRGEFRIRVAIPGAFPLRGAMDQTLADTLTAWRRHLHAHPELTLHEQETAAFVCAQLTELGVPFVAGVGGHGVVATLSRGQSNRSVGLRADMDALPITETSGVPHASTNPGRHARLRP